MQSDLWHYDGFYENPITTLRHLVNRVLDLDLLFQIQYLSFCDTCSVL